MDDIRNAFEERCQEIKAYLDLLDALEQQVQEGTPRLGSTGAQITVQQQKILYSSVYLQLYNLVEATVTKCVDAVCAAIIEDQWSPSDLSDKVRREWVRSIARTHTELNYENRLGAALGLFEHLVPERPVSQFSVEKGEGGNWDDDTIETMSVRLGCSLRISPTVNSDIKRLFRNDLRPLKYIKTLRNDLAHGSLSFAECGEGITVSDLRDLTTRTVLYLTEVVDCFKAYINAHEFLLPTQRPSAVQA